MPYTLPARDVPCPFCGATFRVTPHQDRSSSYDEWWIPEDHTCPGHDEIDVSERLSADRQDEWNREYREIHGPPDMDDRWMGRGYEP